MRFVIKNRGLGRERVGALTGFRGDTCVNIETPTAALLTQGGSVVHLTAEVLSKVFTNPQLLWVPLSDTLQLEAGAKSLNKGIAKFSGLPQHIICTTLHNVSEETQTHHFEGDKVPLWTKNGKMMITADRYMDIMEVFKPDIILAIADGRTSLQEKNKRIIKAVNRTCNMLNTCVQRLKASSQLQDSSLIGVIVGASNLKQCKDALDTILKHGDSLQGVALEGITDGSDESLNKKPEKLKEIFDEIGSAVPETLVRFVEGAWNPAIVLSAIEHGWDIFDGSYVVKLTNAGLALKLNFDVTTKSQTPYILDLIDECYEADFRPMVEGCECLTCEKHTRAYVRHLLLTKELLSTVLLNIHNLHHFDQMFQHARRHIASKTFPTYKEHITRQCEPFSYISYRNSTEKKDYTQKTKKLKRNEDGVGGT